MSERDGVLQADPGELAAIRRLGEQLDPATGVSVSMAGQAPAALPATAAVALQRLLAYLGEQRSVSIHPYGEYVTTQQAANLLNVSRPHLIELVDTGRIPGAYRVGEGARAHRRIPLDGVLTYRERRSLEHALPTPELEVAR